MKFPFSQQGLYGLSKGWRFMKGDGPSGPSGISGTDFDDNAWEGVTLPHMRKEHGTAWYRNSFRLEDVDRDKQILLEFEGMPSEAVVYVNGFVMERLFFDYTPFALDITWAANYGSMPNIVAIRVDGEAGTCRNAWLIKKPAVHLAYDGVFIKPVRENDGWRIDMQVEVENTFKENTFFVIEAEIETADGLLEIRHDPEIEIGGFSTETVNFDVPFYNPTLWDTDEPYLYEAKVSVRTNRATDFITDFIKIPFGFRSLENYAETKLITIPQNTASEAVFRAYKEMGANAYVRTYDTNPEVPDICDRLGIFVIDTHRKLPPSRDAARITERRVRHIRNHPSVIVYSLFDGEPVYGYLRAAILRQDSTRPITCGLIDAETVEEIPDENLSGSAEVPAADMINGQIPAPERINTKVVSGWRMYKEVSDTMPDIGTGITSNENNNMVSVTFGDSYRSLLHNQPGKYALYRTVCDFGGNTVPRILHIGRVSGFFWLYIGGLLVHHTEECRNEGSVEYTISNTVTGKHEVTVILRNMHERQTRAGIYSPVVIREYTR
ncbi:MAG: hypothetical protein FWE90_13275 [Defluviitaleaceae bacterium]|nr:hypothetical protein [Defluviitaleaceae bacterium]